MSVLRYQAGMSDTLQCKTSFEVEMKLRCEVVAWKEQAERMKSERDVVKEENAELQKTIDLQHRLMRSTEERGAQKIKHEVREILSHRYLKGHDARCDCFTCLRASPESKLGAIKKIVKGAGKIEFPLPTWKTVWDAFVLGAKEARKNPDAAEQDFDRAADACCKLFYHDQTGKFSA